jgi:hypothetical protein
LLVGDTLTMRRAFPTGALGNISRSENASAIAAWVSLAGLRAGGTGKALHPCILHRGRTHTCAHTADAYAAAKMSGVPGSLGRRWRQCILWKAAKEANGLGNAAGTVHKLLCLSTGDLWITLGAVHYAFLDLVAKMCLNIDA